MNLNRREVYELVWSRPVTWVAAQLGISSVSLGKSCARAGIPTPPRGHWQRHRDSPRSTWEKLPAGNDALPMPWAHNAAIDQALSGVLKGEGEPVTGAIGTAPVKRIQAHRACNKETSVSPRTDSDALVTRLVDHRRLKQLCQRVERASRYQPLPIARAMRAWAQHVRYGMHETDPVLEVISLCANVVRGDDRAPWWTSESDAKVT
jgi:hypothetical protein